MCVLLMLAVNDFPVYYEQFNYSYINRGLYNFTISAQKKTPCTFLFITISGLVKKMAIQSRKTLGVGIFKLLKTQ